VAKACALVAGVGFVQNLLDKSVKTAVLAVARLPREIN